MNERWEFGRALDQTPTQSPTRYFYVISLIAASGMALGLAWSHSGPATLICASLVAVVAANHAPAALEKKRIAAARRGPATGRQPITERDLNLAGESPTSRAIVEVVSPDALTPGTQYRAASGPIRARWMVTIGTVVFVAIGWFAIFDESATWTMLTRVGVATAAASLVVGIATRRKEPNRYSLAVDRECTDAWKTVNLPAMTKVGLDVRGEDTRAATRRSR